MENGTKDFNNLRIVPWLLMILVLAISFLAWGLNIGWNSQAITVLTVFPLLGLLAWSIMWTHYILGAVGVAGYNLPENKYYNKYSAYAVLALILLHPGLLIWQQWRVNSLLPPGSIYGYVENSLKLFIFMGSLSLLIFLSFEVLNRMKNHQRVRKYWIVVSVSQMLAMTLIFVHAIALGGVLNQEWFLFYWVCLGALLIPAFILVGRSDLEYSRKSD